MMRMRKAFSMITAIFVIVIMATVSTLVLSLSGRTTKTTAVQYRQEQAALLARSYTELAVMAVLNHDRNATTPGTCIENINGVVNGIVPGQAASGSSTSGSGYDVQTRVYYIGNNLPCSTTRILNTSSVVTDYNNTSPAHNDALSAIIVDVYVRYKDPNTDNPASSRWITYHRRTLQKI